MAGKDNKATNDPKAIFGLEDNLDVGTINELQKKKFAARERLRAARQEMHAIDAQLIKAGAPGHVLRAMCW